MLGTECGPSGKAAVFLTSEASPRPPTHSILTILLKAYPTVSCILSQTIGGLMLHAFTVWKTAPDDSVHCIRCCREKNRKHLRCSNVLLGGRSTGCYGVESDNRGGMGGP